MDRRYIPGDRWVRCDECGFGYRYSQIKEGVSLRQKGLGICPDCFDYRHPNTDWRLPPKQEGKLIGGNIGAAEGTGTNYDLPSSDNLLVHYKFNESSGTTADDATGNYDGTITGTVTWGTGKSGNCISTAAGDAYVTIPVSSKTLFNAAFTTTFWLKPDDGQPATAQYPFGAYETGVDGFYISLRADGKIGIQYMANGSQSYATTDDAVFANEAISSFAHIAVTVSSHAGIQVYIAGLEVDTTKTGPTKINMDSWTSTYQPFVLSANVDAAFFGATYADMDDFRIYRGIITDNQALGFV